MWRKKKQAVRLLEQKQNAALRAECYQAKTDADNLAAKINEVLSLHSSYEYEKTGEIVLLVPNLQARRMLNSALASYRKEMARF